jgi:hypothetical protein
MPTFATRAIATLLAAIGASATALEVTVTGFVSERLELTGDRGLSDDVVGNDPAVDSTTDLGLSFVLRGPRTAAVVSPGARLVLSSDREFEARRINPRLNASVTHRLRRSQLSGGLSFVPRLTTDAQFEDTGVVDQDVLQLDGSANLGYDYFVDPRNTLSAGASFSIREFTDETEDLVPSRTVGATLGWSRRVNSTTSASLSTRGRLFTNDDGVESRSVSFTIGGSHAVNNRLAVNARLGPSITDRDGGSGDGSTTFGLVGDASLSYDAGDETFRLGVSQDVDQGSDGSLRNVAAASASYSMQINSVSSLSFSGRVTAQNPLFGDASDGVRTVSIGSTYTYDLTENWNADVGYRLRLRQSDDADLRYGNTVFLSLRRGFSLSQ